LPLNYCKKSMRIGEAAYPDEGAGLLLGRGRGRFETGD
jgi:hypothetical protein